MHFRNALIAVALCAAFVSLAWTQEPTTERRTFRLPEVENLDLPFSDAVLVGDTLYLSGNGGIDLKTMSVPEDPKEEAKLMMENFRRTLAMADMSLENLVSVTVYCPDLSLYSDFNEVYRSYFDGNYPARAFVGSGPLLFGMRFEMQAIAVR